jgi:hypothetical protein
MLLAPAALTAVSSATAERGCIRLFSLWEWRFLKCKAQI